MPLMPLCAVPNQYASTVSLSTPASVNAWLAASMMRSSSPVSKRSPNAVHPIPTIATWSLIPCEPIAVLSVGPDGPGLPEVVVNPVGGEELPERHLDPVADPHRVRVDV